MADRAVFQKDGARATFARTNPKETMKEYGRSHLDEARSIPRDFA
jgi:hypothetical protein